MQSQMEVAPGFRPNGAAIAALVSAAFGLLGLGVIVIITELNEAPKNIVFDVGKLWIPRAADIGPYSGKETVLLIMWLGSWTILHFSLRHREVDTRLWFGIGMLSLLIGTLLVWPPVWHALGA